ncbi:MAG TPA: DUF3011 domain-containing protein [Candidatus Dormibacteraeota bacterium]|nr:DUF3011 domain-containing protein [Candidatus Dormibacteraeota bacterium]
MRSAVVLSLCVLYLVCAALPAQAQPSTNVVNCSSASAGRQQCAADTSAGVVLLKATGPGSCLLGKTWGYDDKGIWVMDGCGGEFQVGQASSPGAPASAAPAAENASPTSSPDRKPTERIETWGEFDPGDGFLVGRSAGGELAISGYGLIRYINQLPASQTYTDHLGTEHPVDTRQDIWAHRVMVFFKGWVGNPKAIYNIILWTVNTTDQKNLFVTAGYQFSRKFSLYGGLNGLPGTRSLQGSHPYWLGSDRVMADEFFRPFFTNGVWASGEPTPGFWYTAMVGNNLSALGVKASQLDRKLTESASVWWMPTTKEFGPKGGYGDWEMHEKLATRFGMSATFSPEQRFTDDNSGAPGNTTMRLADSLNVFDKGALAPGTTINTLSYRLLAVDAGMKYRGFFLQTELYDRSLYNLKADGPLPVSKVHDQGLYVQGAFFPIPKKLELYAATSQIFGDRDAGFDRSSEYLVGMNYYPVDTHNQRVNLQVIDINHSPVSSTFGYYVGGQHGTTVSLAYSLFF